MIALFFDTETTGIKTKANPTFKPALVQLGAILQDTESGRILAEINLINNKPGPIPKEASDIHGIDDVTAMLYGVDPRGLDRLFATMIVKANVVVAHNYGYDEDTIRDNMPDSWANLESKQHFCTKEGSVYVVKAPMTDKQRYMTSKGFIPEMHYKWPTLMELHQHLFDKPFEGAHDAMVDIRATRDCFFGLIEQGWWQILENRVQPTDKLDAEIAAAK